MKNLEIKIKKLNDEAIIPVYQTTNSAGMDISANINKPIILKPMQREIIPTGLSIELPVGYEAQIRARSGLSIKHGITVINGVGTIDSDYRGEIGVLMINLSDENFTIEPNMRVAQMIISKYESVNWKTSGSLVETSRGTDGYGSTGIN